MNFEQELVVAAGLPPEVAQALSQCADVRSFNHTRRDVLPVEKGGMYVVCYGKLVEFFDAEVTTPPASVKRVFLDLLESGACIFSDALLGPLRTYSKTARVIGSGSEWRKDSVLREYALQATSARSVYLARRAALFSHGTATERLEFLKTEGRIVFADWSKQDLSHWAGVSREMVSRLVKDGRKVRRKT